MTLPIPASIAALADHGPTEDFAQALLKHYITDVPIITQISRDQTFPVILVRALPTFTIGASMDERFLVPLYLSIHVFTEDPDGDAMASIISNGCQAALLKAKKDVYIHPKLGHLTVVETTSEPRKVPDWATATGPVQYANLPSNVFRYEGRYRLVVRKPRTPPFASP